MQSAANIKIHIAKKELDLDDETYCRILERVTGKTSSGDMSERERGAVLNELKRLGWTAKHKSASRWRKPSDNPLHRKIWALGNDLNKRGYWKLPWKEGLKKFVKGETDIDDPDWLDNDQASKIIEALKAIVRRHPLKVRKS